MRAVFMALPTSGRLRVRVAMPSLLANNSGSAIDTPHSFPPISGDQSYLDAIRMAPSRRITSPFSIGRSEERRVGKECVSTCRSRWSPYDKKKQQVNYRQNHLIDYIHYNATHECDQRPN